MKERQKDLKILSEEEYWKLQIFFANGVYLPPYSTNSIAHFCAKQSNQFHIQKQTECKILFCGGFKIFDLFTKLAYAMFFKLSKNTASLVEWVNIFLKIKQSTHLKCISNARLFMNLKCV